MDRINDPDESANETPVPDLGPRGSACCGGKAKAETSSCCGGEAKPAPRVSSCCAPAETAVTADCCGAPAKAGRRIDWMLWGSATIVAVLYAAHLIIGEGPTAWHHLAHGAYELMNMMWWGVLLGIVFVGLLDRVPRDVVIAALSGGRRASGLARATAAGVFFDLCSHGILMVGMKLYERGATIGQVAAFLLASPWNSLSLTVILIALIGWQYTVLFILASALIGFVTGWILDALVDAGRLPANPARAGVGEVPSFGTAVRTWWGDFRLGLNDLPAIARSGLSGSRMVLRWLLFGVVLAAMIRAFVPAEVFATWFGVGALGVAMTVIAATIIEVCSEGSTPIAADLVTRAAAPGNGFIFLMAGVSTDYTEVMSLKDTTRSWKLALALPLVSLPQTILIGVLINQLA